MDSADMSGTHRARPELRRQRGPLDLYVHRFYPMLTFGEFPPDVDLQIIDVHILVRSPTLQHRESAGGERAGEHVKRRVALIARGCFDGERTARRFQPYRFLSGKGDLHLRLAAPLAGGATG